MCHEGSVVSEVLFWPLPYLHLRPSCRVGSFSQLGLLERQSVVVLWAGGLALKVGREGLRGGSVLLQTFSWPYRDPRALPPELCWGLEAVGCHFSEVLKNRNKD